MNEAGWRTWAEQMATGLVLVDADLRLLWINRALAEWIELGPRSAVGQPLALLLHEQETLALAARVVAQQRPLWLRGLTLRTAGGRETLVDIAIQPFDGGLLLEVHALVEPVVSGSPLSATLRGFAHEVKNPLAGLRGAAQLLQRRVATDDLQSLAGLIIDEADRLAALANRLLHHNGAAKLGSVNVHHLLERLCDLLRAEPHALQLKQDYDPSVPDVLGDADRLQQILLNLARNAQEAGACTLTLRTRVEHGLRWGDRLLRMALRVDVIDDGHGVPASLRHTLFQPLVSGRADGSGLGLALSREIAREHGGELRYASRPVEAGSAEIRLGETRPNETVFSLYLPLERAHD
jgi:two-component system nitrogen regulation sensor histidine kinase GlnL